MEIKNFRAIHDKNFIEELISEGEHEHQDFKFLISDSRKIARTIAAFANHDGGRLLIGVKDNGTIAGIRSEEEFYMIEQAAEMYCRPAQKVEMAVYSIDGKFVLKADIRKAARRPVLAQDENRRWQIYYRVADENIQAPAYFSKIWQNRIGSGSLVTFSDTESKLLSYVSEQGCATLERIALSVHLSLARAEDTVARLCAMEVLMPVFKAGEWHIALSEPSAL